LITGSNVVGSWRKDQQVVVHVLSRTAEARGTRDMPLLLNREVIKRELGEEADAMKSAIRRLQKAAAKEREKKKSAPLEEAVVGAGD
jgi:hypothetical protein